MKICCFTGHRPHKMYGYDESIPENCRIKYELENIICKLHKQYNVCNFITGMGLGVDIWAAEIVLKLKTADPSYRLEAAVPHENQTARWKSDKERYQQILEKCDKVTVMQNTDGINYTGYSHAAIWKRNYYMIDKSDFVIAVWNTANTEGGTYGTVEYAIKQNKNILVLNPMTMQKYSKKGNK